ncbi:MAG: PAS domain S-box protein, partial [Anaerolineales bacterium]
MDDMKTRVYVSPQIETLLGYTQAEYLADANLWRKMLHPDDQARVLNEAARFYETGEPFTTDYRSVSRDGRVLWFHDEAIIFEDETSRQRYIQGVKIDITALKEAEDALSKAHDDLERLVQERTAALSQANTLLQTMLDHVPDHIFFKDLQSRFIRNSRSQAEMLGLSDPSQVVGKSDFDFFPHAQQAYDEEQSIIRSGQTIVDFEEYVIWPDGRQTWVSTTKVPLRDEQGQIVGTFGIARDITERKRADETLRKAKDGLEARVAERTAELNKTNEQLRLELGERKQAEQDLRAAETRYRTLIEQLPIIVYVNPARDISSTTYVSPQIRSLLGYTQEEWLEDPKSWSKALHPEDRQRLLAGVELINQSGEP